MVATGITRPFDQAFYGGHSPSSSGGTSTHNFDVYLAGRGYMIDWEPPSGDMTFSFKTLPLLQRYYLTQQEGNIGEQSLNPEDFWRRSSDDWHFGSGQKYNDRSLSQRGQYRASSGIDPWDIGEITLLPDTTQLRSSSNVMAAVNAGSGFWYLLDGDSLFYATDLSGGFTEVTASGGDSGILTAESISTDGDLILVADATRVHFTNRADATYSAYHASDEPADLVRIVKGRVFTTNGPVLSYSTGTAGSAVSNPFLTRPSGFSWVDIAGGPAAIYFAGYSGDKSVIYSTQVVSDGTNLAVPAVAAELPDGEIVRALSSYLGVLLIGTDKGARIATMDASGNLTLGGLIPTANGVYAFEPQDRFVWFGGGDADDSDNGCDLYRMDLSLFNGSVPAYASDLRNGTVAGVVTSILTFGNKRVYVKDGQGVYAEDPDGNLVAEGTMFQGWWNYNLPDHKQAVKLSTQYTGNGGRITFATASDFVTLYEQAGAVISSSDNAESTVLPVRNTEGVVHEVKVTLERSTIDTTSGPVVTRYTLMSNPQPQRRVEIMVPLQLHSEVQTHGGDTVAVNPGLERALIDGYCQAGEIISYQDPSGTYSVTVDDYDWIGYQPTGASRSLDGTLGVRLKVVS